MGSSPIYRGEISQLADDIFINYSLVLPDVELASTSGYFMKELPLRYSYFTLQRGATSQPVQTTVVHQIDGATGKKAAELMSVAWSSNGSNELYLGLVAGYDLPGPLDAAWQPVGTPCYLSMAGVPASGGGSGGLARQRITAWDSALLTIHLPADESTADLVPFLYHYQQPLGSAPPELPQATPVTNSITRLPDRIVIGAPGEPLPLGLYVLARPAG